MAKLIHPMADGQTHRQERPHGRQMARQELRIGSLSILPRALDRAGVRKDVA